MFNDFLREGQNKFEAFDRNHYFDDFETHFHKHMSYSPLASTNIFSHSHDQAWKDSENEQCCDLFLEVSTPDPAECAR